jgi:protein-tyrosine phosphatase
VPVTSPTPEPSTFTVLVVCTGNICRSALAERLGRAFLDDVAGEDASQIRIVSAGTRAVVGSAMHPHSELVLHGLGAVAGEFRARQIDDRMVADADLTLTMTRAHRREVLERNPRALARTFTLREAADLLDRMGDARVEGETLADRAGRLVQGLAGARSGRQSGPDDDVRDPIGHPMEVHDEVGAVIAESLLPLLRRIAGAGGR